MCGDIKIVRILCITAKCSDLCEVFFEADTKTGKYIEHHGYVPDGLGIGCGDYIDLSIDVDTGKVVGWNTDLTNEEIKDAFENA